MLLYHTTQYKFIQKQLAQGKFIWSNEQSMGNKGGAINTNLPMNLCLEVVIKNKITQLQFFPLFCLGYQS